MGCRRDRASSSLLALPSDATHPCKRPLLLYEMRDRRARVAVWRSHLTFSTSRDAVLQRYCNGYIDSTEMFGGRRRAVCTKPSPLVKIEGWQRPCVTLYSAPMRFGFSTLVCRFWLLDSSGEDPISRLLLLLLFLAASLASFCYFDDHLSHQCRGSSPPAHSSFAST